MEALGRRGFDASIDLSTNGCLLVEQDDRQIERSSLACRGHSGGAGADYDEVRHGVTHHDSSPELASSRLAAPIWRRTCIPSWTVTMQLCLAGTPSISTRHSKQAPIMQ